MLMMVSSTAGIGCDIKSVESTRLNARELSSAMRAALLTVPDFCQILTLVASAAKKNQDIGEEYYPYQSSKIFNNLLYNHKQPPGLPNAAIFEHIKITACSKLRKQVFKSNKRIEKTSSSNLLSIKENSSTESAVRENKIEGNSM